MKSKSNKGREMRKYRNMKMEHERCACYNSETAYGLDGKAVGWCEARNYAEKQCKNRGGIEFNGYRHYDPLKFECADGFKGNIK